MRIAWALALLWAGCGNDAGDATPPPPATGEGNESATPLERALSSSATGPRLEMVGLSERGDDLRGALPASEVGASAAFRAERPDGSAYAEVYWLERPNARAHEALAAVPPPDGARAMVTGNGPFLVRVVVRGDGTDAEAELARIVSTIAGEE